MYLVKAHDTPDPPVPKTASEGNPFSVTAFQHPRIGEQARLSCSGRASGRLLVGVRNDHNPCDEPSKLLTVP